MVVATDAPLLPHQLRRVARRAALGIGRMGGVAGAGSVAFSPDGRLAAVADRDLKLIELASGTVVRSFASGAGSVYGLTFTPDGQRLISAHDDGTALVWDVSLKAPPGLDRARAWDELASDDAAAARRAMASLVAHPGIAVELFGEKLKPIPKPAGRRTTAALKNVRVRSLKPSIRCEAVSRTAMMSETVTRSCVGANVSARIFSVPIGTGCWVAVMVNRTFAWRGGCGAIPPARSRAP